MWSMLHGVDPWERRPVRRGGRARPAVLALTAALATVASASAADLPVGTCFDFTQKVVEPLTPVIPLLPGRDNHVFGTSPGGVGWASGRVVLDMPVAAAYASLLDHRNVKDMTKTTIASNGAFSAQPAQPFPSRTSIVR